MAISFRKEAASRERASRKSGSRNPKSGPGTGNGMGIGKGLLKVAEYSFQVPMPNSPLLLNYL